VVQHALAMLDLATAEPAGVGPVQTRRVTFQSVFLLRTARPQREGNDHDDHSTLDG
jgi:hypothetical protein